MHKEVNLHIIKVKRSQHRSRFLVNLNKIEKAEPAKKKRFFFPITEKLNEGPDFIQPFHINQAVDKPDNMAPLEKNFVDSAKNKNNFSLRKNLPQVASRLKNKDNFAPAIGLDTGRKKPSIIGKQLSKIERLAFFVLAKFIFDIFIAAAEQILRAGYWVGWTSLFLIRLIVIIAAKTLSPLGILARTMMAGIRERRQKVNENIRQIRESAGKKFSTLKDNSASLVHGFKASSAEKLPGTSFFYQAKNETAWQSTAHISSVSRKARLNILQILFKSTKKIKEETSVVGTKIKTMPLWHIRPQDLLPRPQLSFVRPTAFFLLALFVLITPIKGFTYYRDISNTKSRVLGVSETAVSELKNASESISGLNFSEAGKSFSVARDNFQEAMAEIEDISVFLKILAPLIPDQRIKLASQAEKILEAGRLSSGIGQDLSELMFIISGPGQKNIGRIAEEIAGRGQDTILQAGKLEENIKQIKLSYIPDEYRPEFELISEKIGLINKSLSELVELAGYMKEFLGFSYDKRYLLVFQNNTEMRGSGGFIGSYALIDFRNGAIKKIDAPTGGSYDTTAGMLDAIVAPEPLWLVSPRWYFWDANWWPDWPTTARNLIWFFENSDEPSVDGVISLTPTVMEKILRIVGPIDLMEKYGVVVDQDNFWNIVQAITEKKPDDFLETEIFKRDYIQENLEENELADIAKQEPKEIIGDLMHALLEKLTDDFDRETILSLVSEIDRSFQEKQILFYLKNKDLQAKVGSLGWDGRVLPTSHDYLQVVNTNISGGKSDKAIKEKINHYVKISSDGSITDTLTITRVHTAFRGEELTGMRNTNWLRVYVPQGSELLEASGFASPDKDLFEQPDPDWLTESFLSQHENLAQVHESSGTKIYTEFGKTVFANWTILEPEEEQVVRLVYRLPFKLAPEQETSSFMNKYLDFLNPEGQHFLPFSLLVQKQPGSLGSEFNSFLDFPPAFKSVWTSDDGIIIIPGSWTINSDLAKDRFWALVLSSSN